MIGLPRLLSPLFSSNLACFKCNIPLCISQKAKQAHFKIKCNTINPLLTPPPSLFERGGLCILEKTMVSVLHKELENIRSGKAQVQEVLGRVAKDQNQFRTSSW